MANHHGLGIMRYLAVVVAVILVIVILGAVARTRGVWMDPLAAIRGTERAEVSIVPLSGWGIIESQQDVIVSAESGGRVVYVGGDEGDEIKAGTVLVRQDDELLLTRIAQAEAAVRAAEAGLAAAKAKAPAPEIAAERAGLQAAEAQAEAARAEVDIVRASLHAAEASYRGAQAAFDKLARGASERELEFARLQTDLARNALWETQARRDAAKSGMDDPLSVPLVIGDLDLGNMTVANPSAPRQWDLDRAEGTVSGAEASVVIADLRYEQVKAGPSTDDLDIAQAQVAKARAGELAAAVRVQQAEQAAKVAQAQIGQSEAQLDLVASGARADAVSVAQAEVAQARAEMAILEVRRDKLSVAAPITGVITQRTVQEGEIVLAGAQLLTLSMLDPLALTIYVPEGQIGRVTVGQRAEVHVDAYPGRAFAGEVIQISSRAEFTPRDVRTRDERVNTVFGVRIRLPNPDRALRPGMPADAVIRSNSSDIE